MAFSHRKRASRFRFPIEDRPMTHRIRRLVVAVCLASGGFCQHGPSPALRRAAGRRSAAVAGAAVDGRHRAETRPGSPTTCSTATCGRGRNCRPRDRSLVTVAALIAMNRPDQLRSHLTRARQNGVTEEELVETITHLAFYTGWPNAVSAVSVAPRCLRDQMRRGAKPAVSHAPSQPSSPGWVSLPRPEPNR